jgi:Tfp pilus assembly PilM family ATPase
MKTIRKAGIAFDGATFRCVEVEWSKKTTVTAMIEAQADFDISREGRTLSPEHPATGKFTAQLRSILKANKITASTMSFALPTDAMFIHVVPVDGSLQGESLKEHTAWEFSHYLDMETNGKEMITISTSLESALGGSKQMVMVAVSRKLIGFLQKVCTDLGLIRDVVDIDHLSVEKTIQYNYPEVKGYPVALFGLRSNFIDAGLLIQGESVDYRGYACSSATEVKRVVNDYIQYLKERDANQLPAALFFHGLDVSRELRIELGKETNIQSVQINTLRKIEPPKKIAHELVLGNSRFAAALGLALR